MIGDAFAAFDCPVSRHKIELELPTVRSLGHVPWNLELAIYDSIKKLPDRDAIREFHRLQHGERQYAMHARFPQQTNLAAARELSVILHQLYQSPFYEPGAPFFGEILFQFGPHYVKWEGEH